MDFQILTYRTRRYGAALALVTLWASGSCEGPRVGVVECTSETSEQDCGEDEFCSNDHTCEPRDPGTGGSNTGGVDGTGGSVGSGTGGTIGKGGNPTGGNSGEAGDEGVGGSDSAGSGNAAGSVGNGGMAGAMSAGAGGSAGAAGSSGVTGSEVGRHCTGCLRAKRGNPSWEPKGAIILLASVGTRGPGATIFPWLSMFLAPNHRWYMGVNVFGPSINQHPPPYDEEMYDLSQVGLRPKTPKQVFSVAEYSAPSGIVLLFNLVPSSNAPMGLASEFDSGPIIPNDLFPLLINFDVYRDGLPEISEGDSYYPDYNSLGEPVREDGMPVDGASHVMMEFSVNDTFTSPGPGTFEYNVTITDHGGGGWEIIVPYTVE